MKYLILGGNRFIGKKIAENLISIGHDVTVLNRSGTGPDGSTIIKHDRNLGFKDAMFKEWRNPHYFDVVIDFCLFKQSQAISLFETLSPHQRYIFISSAAAYKDSFHKIYSETMSTGGREGFGGYGKEKSECEDVIIERNVNHTIFRPPYIVGKDCPRPRLKYYIESILNSGKARVPGNGRELFSLVWADDVVSTLLDCILGPIGSMKYHNIFNLSGSDIYNHVSLVNDISEFLKRDVEILYNSTDTPFINENLILSTNRLNREFVPIKYRLKEFCEYSGIKYE